MMHYKRRLIPVNLLDIPAVETWLADLAEKGLFLVSSGNYFAKFETAEPAKVTYRLEVTADPFLRADPDKKNTVFSGIWLGIPESFPMVCLAEIEQEDSLRLAPSGDYGNCILHNQTFFAPEQYTVRQAASVNGRQWADDSDRAYSPFLTMELYRLRFPALAGPTLHSLKRHSTRYGIWEKETWEGFGTEEAYLYTSTESPGQQQVFLRTGDTVICLDYRGESDIRPFLPEFIALAQADFPAIEP